MSLRANELDGSGTACGTTEEEEDAEDTAAADSDIGRCGTRTGADRCGGGATAKTGGWGCGATPPTTDTESEDRMPVLGPPGAWTDGARDTPDAAEATLAVAATDTR